MILKGSARAFFVNLPERYLWRWHCRSYGQGSYTISLDGEEVATVVILENGGFAVSA